MGKLRFGQYRNIKHFFEALYMYFCSYNPQSSSYISAVVTVEFLFLLSVEFKTMLTKLNW